jgi:hypothetical protein
MPPSRSPNFKLTHYQISPKIDFPHAARIVRAPPKKAGESPGLRAATRWMALLG